MAAKYNLYLADDRGRRLMTLNNLASFSAGKEINSTAPFSGVLRKPANTAQVQNYHYIERGIRRDWQVQVWRKARGPEQLWNSYFLLRWGWGQNPQGEEVFSIGGEDQNHLLTRRVVAAKSTTEESQSNITDLADDMMKTVATDSMEDDADPVPESGTRAWGDLSVANNTGKGPELTLGFSFRKLLTMAGGGVMSQISRAAREAGTEVYFWVVPSTISTSSVTYQFRTYIGQPGHDHTSGPSRVVFSADDGTLSNWFLGYDYTEAENAIYALGRGIEEDRTIVQQYDVARYKSSYWGRSEGKIDARNQEDDAIINEAREALCDGRPRISLDGKPVNTRGQTFGRHYDVGDKVIAKAKGREFQALVWSAEIGKRPNGESFEDVRLEIRDAS